MSTCAMNITPAGQIESAASSSGHHHNHILSERVDVGHYRLHHVLRLAATGWRLSIPRGDDGQPMFTVEAIVGNRVLDLYLTDANGAIDIPEGRTLTVRCDATDPPPFVSWVWSGSEWEAPEPRPNGDEWEWDDDAGIWVNDSQPIL